MSVIQLKEILKESKVVSESPDPDKRIKIRSHLKGIEKRPFKTEVKGATKYYIRSKNQFIYSKLGFIEGAFGIIPDCLDGFETSSDGPCFDIDERCLPEWLLYSFIKDGFYKKFSGEVSGTSQKRISPYKILKESIYLPSVDIQKQLLNKINIFNGLYKQFNENITQISLSSLKSKILDMAVRGELVEQDENDEPAEILFEKIQLEKEKLVKEGKIKKQPSLPKISEDEIPYQIPKNWKWCRLGDIITFIGGGAYKSYDFIKNSNNQVLRLGNVKNDLLLLESSPVFINNTIAESTKKYQLNKNDILITMTGTRNKKDYAFTTILKEEYFKNVNLFLNQRVGCLRSFLKQSFIVNLFLKSDIIRNSLLSKETGTANQGNIGSNHINTLMFPLPPLEEQKRIVKKVDKLMTLCDELENKTLETKELSSKLLDAVLNEALSKGE